MLTIPVPHDFSIIGTWKGFGFPEMPAQLSNTPLSELLQIVKEKNPKYSEIPVIQNQKRLCRNLLLKNTQMSLSRINMLINFDGGAKGLRDAWSIAAKKLDLVNEPLWEQLEVLRSMRIKRLWEMLKAGVLGFSAQEEWGQTNKVLDAYTNTLSRLMRGIGGVNDTLEIQGCVVGAGYSVPATDQTSLGHQLGSSKTPDASTYANYQTTFLTGFLPADNNGAETTISSVSGTPKQIFDITSATGFSTGDRVIINNEKRTISDLTGTTVTLDAALTNTPVVTDVFRQIWGESGLLINGDSALGTRARISNDGFDKTDTKGIFIESALTVRIV